MNAAFDSHFAQILEAAPGLFLVLAPDRPNYTVLAATDTYLRAAGIRRSQIIGRSFFEVFPDNPIAAAETSATDNSRASLDRALDLRLPDAMAVQRQAIQRHEAQGNGFQQRLWRQLNTPVINASGEVTCLIHSVEDVTDLVRLQQRDEDQQFLAGVLHSRAEQAAELQAANRALRASEAWLREVLDALPAAVYTTDVEGRLTHFNPAAVELSGRVPQLGVDRWCVSWKLFRADGTPLSHADCPMAVAIKEGRAIRGVEAIAERPDGTRIWAMPHPTPLRDAQGQVVGGINMLVDITERKRGELDLHNAMVATQKANQAKSEFLSSLSHELRSPLNAILGFAQLMASGSPLPTPSQKESIEQISQAGWYLLQLIDEILDLSLIESGRLSLRPEPVALSELLSECRAMVEPLAQKRSIRLHFPSLDQALHVHADRTRLKQVLINLLSNAIKYNRSAGSIEVICSATTAQRLRISFHDTGQGLAAEQLEQLFQPFNRLGQEAGAEEGTGIGLVVSKRLVELMGGEIGAESRLGVGSVFWAELDRADAVRQPAAATQSTPLKPVQAQADAAQRTLLCVDDNPADLLLIGRLIARRPDIHLLCESDGRCAVETARCARPDVILMDINLPGIDGWQALEMLADDAATASIPVIALSANAMPDDIEKSLQAGFFRYLTKPIKVSELMDTLDLALEMPQGAINLRQ